MSAPNNGHKENKERTNTLKTKDIYPSKYLKASDIPDAGVTVKMKSFALEKFDGDDEAKLIIGFEDTAKLLACNRTNKKVIEKIHGDVDDTDEWIGKAITLVKREVNDDKGNTVVAIRVSLLGAQPAAVPA